MVAVVTPFKNGSLDETALRKLIDWQITAGTAAIVPCGTTGEAPCISYEEHLCLVSVAVEQTAGRVPVIAGAGANCTANAIKLTKQAKAAGADGTLHVTPYYNKPTQEGLYQHFKAIAEAVDLPMILYNVPGRTSVHMSVETTLRLSKIANIVGIKEASGKLEEIDRLVKETDDNFGVYSGEDALNAEIYALGGGGAVSVTANVAPNRVAAVWSAFAVGNKREGFELQEKLRELNQALFLETNPIPVKTALALMGKCEETFRLPLCTMAEGNKNKLIEVLKKERLL